MAATRDQALAEIGRVTAGATRIETRCGGGSLVWHVWGGGRPVMLLHGGSGSWTHWIRNVERDRLTRRRLAQTSLVHDTIRCLDLPLHLIAGRLDVLYRDQWEAIHASLDEVRALRSRVLIDGAGHWVPFEAAERYNVAVLALLED